MQSVTAMRRRSGIEKCLQGRRKPRVVAPLEVKRADPPDMLFIRKYGLVKKGNDVATELLDEHVLKDRRHSSWRCGSA